MRLPLSPETAILSGTALLLFTSCMPVFKPQQAEQIAQQELLEYSRRHYVPLSEFVLVDTESSDSYPWIFTYQTKTDPQHTVVVMVSHSGSTELSFLIEKNEAHEP